MKPDKYNNRKCKVCLNYGVVPEPGGPMIGPDVKLVACQACDWGAMNAGDAEWYRRMVTEKGKGV